MPVDRRRDKKKKTLLWLSWQEAEIHDIWYERFVLLCVANDLSTYLPNV
jgi:hypothetical protein